MNLRNISDEMLLEKTSNLAKKEREITLEVLHHLREVERRSLFAKLAYSSLFEYVVHELKYSEGAAQRRISSMRLLKELPEIEKKVESGVLTLSALSQAQTFFRQEKLEIKSAEQKMEVLMCLENKSLWEVQRELVSRSTQAEKLIPEKLRPVSQNLSELKILIEESLLGQIEELRGLVASSKPNASIKDLIAFAICRTLKEMRPKEPKEGGATAAAAVINGKARYVPREVKRKVWQRDKGQCTFVGANKKRCCSNHGLELDHIKPFAAGGQATVDNLRLRCRTHNQLAAVHWYGAGKMEQYVPRMR